MTMKFSKKQVTLTVDILWAWLDTAWDRCWKQIASDPSFNQDYLTASDLERDIRWQADRSAGETVGKTSWGHNAWTRLIISDKPPRYTLLDLVRVWLNEAESDGKIVGHNFGRGHISGKRYRPANVPVPEREKKTMEDKKKEKPVHYVREGIYGPVFRPLCTQEQKRGVSYYTRSRRNMNIRVTNEKDKVTCPRCLKKMEKGEE